MRDTLERDAMRGHPDNGDWLDLALGRVGPVERELLEAHVAEGCTTCVARRQWAQRVAVVRSVELDEPTPKAVSAARCLLSKRWKPGSAARFRMFVAQLLPTDDLATSAVRSSGDSAPSEFAAGPYLMEIRLADAGISGRIVRADGGDLPTAAAATLEGVETVIGTSTIAADGAFTISGRLLDARLLLDLGEDRVEIRL